MGTETRLDRGRFGAPSSSLRVWLTRHPRTASSRLFIVVIAIIGIALLMRPSSSVAYDGVVYENGEDIWMADSDGGSPHRVAYRVDSFLRASLTGPQLSPNGQYVAFTYQCDSCTDGFDNVEVLMPSATTCPPTGYNSVTAYNVNRRYRDVRWHPSGRSLVYAYTGKDETTGYDLMSAPLAVANGCPGAQTAVGDLVLRWPGDQRHPSYSPDGAWLAFDSTQTSDGTAFSDGPHVFVASADGSGAQDLGAGAEPSFSADGQHVVYQSLAKAGYQIYSIPRVGGRATRLTSPRTGSDTSPSYTPDGAHIIFTRCTSGSCALWSMSPDGSEQVVLLSPGRRGTARAVSADVTYGDVLAAEFRPKLMFDEGEKWRPLEISSFLTETVPGDPSQPLHQVCSADGACESLSGESALQRHNAAGAFIDIGTLPDDAFPDTLVYRSPYQECSEIRGNTLLLDCDRGARSAVYYNATVRSAGYNYVDYWWFYRNNEFPLDNHEGDWEGMTIAPSADAHTFDWVSFAQHAFRSVYLRDNLECDDGGEYSCDDLASRPKRVWAYVAGGTHATYPDKCTDLCPQLGPGLVEGDHGGEQPWGNNDDDAAFRALPATLGGRWTDWQGRWGSTGDPSGSGSPASPAMQRRFKCPWEGNDDDATACTASVATATKVDRAASTCASWFGSDVDLVVCEPRILTRAIRRGAVHGGQGPVVRVLSSRGRRTGASARGIAQVMGRQLTAGTRVALRGRHGTATVLVRAVRGRRSYRAVLRMGRKNRRWSGVLSFKRQGRGLAVRLAHRGPKATIHMKRERASASRR